MTDIHREAFREEAYEILTQLEAALLELEAEPEDGDLIATVFRYMHTIKGSGAMFGFDDIASFTHEVETVFDLVRSGRIPVTKELINLTLLARDRIRTMLDGPETGGPAETEEIISSFRRLLPDTKLAPAPPALKADEDIPAFSPPPESRNAYRIRFTPSPTIFQSGAKPTCLLNELRELGSAILTVNTDNIPALEDLDPEFCYTSWDIVLVSCCTMDAIKDVFIFVEDECELSIRTLDTNEVDSEGKRLGEILLERGDITAGELDRLLGKQKRIGELLVESGVSPQKVGSALVEQQQVNAIRKERHNVEQQSSIRVPAERLDHLVNLVGEQVTVQARLAQFALSLGNQELVSIAEEVARLTADLRDSTLNIRMLPIGATFSKFRRLVRDLSRDLGKEVEMTTEGEETELDKTVIEKLNDPLIHMIRNCIDHAIEPPETRAAKGKPRQGSVHLAAVHSGDSVYISIKDDGSGLDREAIFAKAAENGLVSAHAELTEKEIYSLIFTPGFSTAREVTSVSGRGVGMDVVKQSIEELRGSIDIKSEAGKGTTFTVRIPLTLAIIESLLVKIGDDHFMFPLSHVDECMFLTEEDVERAHGRQFVQVRDKIIPFINLRDKFGVIGVPPPFEQLVITAVDGDRIGFVVDDIIGQDQTVIKSLGSAYKDVEGVSGATILGNGSVALILDVPKLYHSELLQAQGYIC